MEKVSYITPVPKKSTKSINSDFKSVAITSIVLKCLENLAVSRLKSNVNLVLDPSQFAYKEKRGTADAINSVINFILKHLDNSNPSARLLFVDFSCALWISVLLLMVTT